MKTIAAVLVMVVLTAAGGTHARPFAAASSTSLHQCGRDCELLVMPDDGGSVSGAWAEWGQFVVADIGADRGCFLCGIEQDALFAMPREVAFAGQTTQGNRIISTRIFDPSD